MPPENDRSSADAKKAAFPQTRWSLVRRVREVGPEATAALDEICRRYWYPIYAFLRRQGHQPSDAEDITQSFFVQVLKHETLRAAAREKGQLRSFLLGALKRHLADHFRSHHAEKRGGGVAPLPIEWNAAEQRYSIEPVDESDPEKIFARAWAAELLQTVSRQLGAALAEAGRADEYRLLETYLAGAETAPPYSELARQLGSTESNVRVLVFRLRRRFRALLEEEIQRTVEGAEDVAAEIAWMHSVLQ